MALPSPCQGCWGWRERGRHRQPVLLRRRSSSPCGSVRAEFRSPWKAKNRLRAGSSAWCAKAGQRQRERGCAPSASQDRKANPAQRSSPDGNHNMRRTRKAKRSEEHTSELQSLMRISYAVFCLKKKKIQKTPHRRLPNNKVVTPHTSDVSN